MDYELALENLNKFISLFETQASDLTRNEATTRLQLIDKMLLECLGWERDYIESERYNHGEYTDYELGIPQKRIIIEAKREGITFELPTGFTKVTCALKTIYNLDESIRSAIDQVMRYCNERGIPIATVTNGHQYILFICNRQDGIPPMDGSSLVFSSLRNILENFRLFWNSLSFAGIEENKVLKILKGDNTIPAPDKLSAKIVNYPGFKNRNPIAAELQILGGLFLEDIGKIPASEKEFVESTYCMSGALSQYALVSKEILGTRYTSYFEKESRGSIESVTTKHGINEDLKNDLFTAGLSRRPIILIGDVGVGKSMFIKHLLYVGAKKELENTIVIYLDFGAKPTFAKELDKYIINEISNQLLEKYNIDIYEKNFIYGVYNLEIERFNKSIYSQYKESDPIKYKDKEIEHIDNLSKDPENHLKACLKHIVKGRKKQVVIFLDNVDQRTYEFQDKVFLISQSLAEEWPVVAFITLRPDTFAKSKSAGTLAAYQPRIFTIDPPRVDRVVRKRLDYALNKLKDFGNLSNLLGNVQVDSNTLEKYIEMLIQTFEKSGEIIEFIDNLSNGNLRKVIEYIGIFVGSAHVDSRKILKIINDTGEYRLPLHEFLRALIFKDNEYYNPEDSVFINIYEISNDNVKGHFIILFILAIVEKNGKKNLNEGFIETKEIYKILQEIGYNEKEIEISLFRCIKNSLLAAPNYEEDIAPIRLRILPAGAYTLLKLGCMFTYIDSIIIDTPIVYHEYREKIHDIQTIDERISRVEIFLEYLEKSWEGINSECFNWKEYSQNTKTAIHNIKYSLKKDKNIK
jgi:hypothetical protein